jgi:hypothetical protein
MHRLGWADAEQDSQDHRIRDLQGQGRIEAGAALLDRGKMECRGVGDGLNMRVILCVGIGSGDCRMRPFEQVRDGLGKDAEPVEIRIMVWVAVPCPITGVDGKLREIGEPLTDFFSVDPVAVLPFKVRNLSRLTAWIGPRNALMKAAWLNSSSVLSCTY